MGKTILIVEDEPKNMKLLRDLLQRFGYEILEAFDGEQGVKSAGENIPNLILMDIMMPKMDGLEATRIIKAEPENQIYTHYRAHILCDEGRQGEDH